MVHYRGERGGVDLARHGRFAGRKDLVDIVAKTVVVLLAEMDRKVAANPNQKDGRSCKQKSVPVHRDEVGVKQRLRRNYITESQDATRSGSAAALALLSSSRLVPNCLINGNTARVRKRRALIPPPPIRRFS